jgi:hypothetical protein
MREDGFAHGNTPAVRALDKFTEKHQMNFDAAQSVSALLLLSVFVLLAIALGQSAKKHGRSAILWTILGLIISPLFAWIALAILTGIQAYKQPRQ